MGTYTHPSDDFTDDSEEVLLARVLFGEARSEPEEGKFAVAYVIKNRVRQKKRTYHQVILQPFQFSAFNKNDPNYEKLKDPEAFDPAQWEKCLEVARYVHSCKDDRNTIGAATHYHTAAVSPDWAEGGTVVRQIGAHIFYEDVAYSVPDNQNLLMKGRAMADIDKELERIQKKVDILRGLAELVPLTEEQKEKLSEIVDGLIEELDREIDSFGEGGDEGEGGDQGEGADEGGGGEGPGDDRPGRNLRRGDGGDDVRKLQDRLREMGFDPGPSDGQFGENTENALKEFQEANGLEPDGVAGPDTYDKLFGE